MNAPTPKNKTTAAWLALIGGQFGLHRLYLFGMGDLWAWVHPIAAALGWWGVERARRYGQDDTLSWVLIPILGFTLTGTALTAIYYGLMPPEKWNAQHNPGAQDAPAGSTSWLTIGAVVLALLLGTTALMSSIAISFQRYFEYQIDEARKISQ
ncbi:MAG: TM2 domain-containing protein [Polaromonas sp.]